MWAIIALAFALGFLFAAMCPAAEPETLRDVLSLLPPEDIRAAAGPDGCKVTLAHEATHFVNSKLSKPGVRGFYLGDADVWTFPIPSQTKLAHVAEAIPRELRGKTYKTYLIDAQQWWQDCPLYPFDEAVAYWAGAKTRIELGLANRQETERFGVELLVYSQHALDQIKRREPASYPHAELDEFLDVLVARARIICREFDRQPYAESLSGRGWME